MSHIFDDLVESLNDAIAGKEVRRVRLSTEDIQNYCSDSAVRTIKENTNDDSNNNQR